MAKEKKSAVQAPRLYTRLILSPRDLAASALRVSVRGGLRLDTLGSSFHSRDLLISPRLKHMKRITIQQAEKHLSQLIQRALKGERIIIGSNDGALVQLIPVVPTKGPRRPGALKSKFRVGKEFFEPLPEDELRAWE